MAQGEEYCRRERRRGEAGAEKPGVCNGVGRECVLTPPRPEVMGQGCGVRPCGSVPPGRGGKRTVGELAGSQGVGAQPTLQGKHADHRARAVGERARVAARGDQTEGALGRWSVVRGPPDSCKEERSQ